VIGAVIVAVVLAGAAAVVVLRYDHNQAPVKSHTSARPPTGAPLSAAPPSTKAAALAPPASPVLVTSSAGYSEYRLSGPATIILAASGTCWVQIRQGGPAGQVLYEGDLHAGDKRGTPGSTWLRLGNPAAVTITVNGVALSPPTLIAGQPYNLQFE
jgi:hypothetical protein